MNTSAARVVMLSIVLRRSIMRYVEGTLPLVDQEPWYRGSWRALAAYVPEETDVAWSTFSFIRTLLTSGHSNIPSFNFSSVSPGRRQPCPVIDSSRLWKLASIYQTRGSAQDRRCHRSQVNRAQLRCHHGSEGCLLSERVHK